MESDNIFERIANALERIAAALEKWDVGFAEEPGENLVAKDAGLIRADYEAYGP